MVKGIRSGEIIGVSSVKQGDPPRHTEEGHERCAYYMEYDTTERIWLFNCPHGASAKGAFYSEDFIRDLRETFHYVDGIGAFIYRTVKNRREAAFSESVEARLDPDDVGKANFMIENLREMLK